MGVDNISSRSALAKPGSVLGVVSTVALPIAALVLFRDLLIFGAVLLAVSWISISFTSSTVPELRFSAARLYLPIFVGYSVIGLGTVGLQNWTLIAWSLVLSSLAFAAGWVLSLNLTGTRRNLRNEQEDDPKDGLFSIGLVFAVSSGTVLLYLALWVHAGSIPAFSADPNIARTKFYPSGYVAMFVVMGVHIMSTVGLVWLFTDKRRRFSGLFLWLLALLLGLGTANRGIVFIPTLLAVFYIAYRTRLNTLRLMPFAVAGLVVFGLLGLRRSQQANGSEVYSRYLESMGFYGPSQLFAPVLRYIYATAETYDRTIAVFPSSVPFPLGEQFFSPILLKQSVDLYLKDVLGDTFGGFGLALGSMNAFYLDWGIPGVILGALVLGVLSAVMFRKALQSGSPRWIMMYSYVLVFLFLSNYGHPFAYLYYVIEPVIMFNVIRNPKRHQVRGAEHREGYAKESARV